MRLLFVLFFIGFSVTAIGYPTSDQVSSFMARIKVQKVSNGYPFRELYAECKNEAEADRLFLYLKERVKKMEHQLLNAIAYARQVDGWGNHLRALKVLDELDQSAFLQASSTVNYEYSNVLGIIALNSQNPTLALKHFRTALYFAKKSDQPEIIQAGYSNVGNSLNALERSNEALTYFQNALKLEVEGVNRNSLYLRLNIALTHSKLGQYRQAKQQFQTALFSLKSANDVYAESRTLMNLADIYVQEDSLDLADSYLKQAQTVAQTNGLTLVMIDIFSSRSRLAERNGNYKESLIFLRKSDSLSYAMNGSQNISSALTVLESEKMIAFNQLEKELAEHQLAATRKERTYLMVLVVLLTVGLIIFVVQFRSLRLKNKHLLHNALHLTRVSEAPDETKIDKVLISRLDEFVQEKKVHHDPLLTIEKLAKLLNTNRTYLSQSMNSYYGVSFRKWINELRIQESKVLLMDEKLDHFSIEAIAEMVGFSSISSFNENFKKVTGLTPSYFRKARANKGLREK